MSSFMPYMRTKVVHWYLDCGNTLTDAPSYRHMIAFVVGELHNLPEYRDGWERAGLIEEVEIADNDIRDANNLLVTLRARLEQILNRPAQTGPNTEG